MRKTNIPYICLCPLCTNLTTLGFLNEVKIRGLHFFLDLHSNILVEKIIFLFDSENN